MTSDVLAKSEFRLHSHITLDACMVLLHFYSESTFGDLQFSSHCVLEQHSASRKR